MVAHREVAHFIFLNLDLPNKDAVEDKLSQAIKDQFKDGSSSVDEEIISAATASKMKYDVYLAPRAKRQYERFDTHIRKEIKTQLLELKDDPYGKRIPVHYEIS